MSPAQPFKWRHFEGEIILLCVRWYLRYALSYRDLEEMMQERGLSVDHTTVYRWVQHYAPLDRRCRAHLKPTTDSYRVDLIGKGQVLGVDRGNIQAQNRFMAELFGLAA